MLGSSRLLEGRLLGISYASFDPLRARKPFPREQLKEALAIANKNRNDTEAERLSNEALVYSFGNELDLAIQTLVRATASKGAKPWMWSDLSALYMKLFLQSGESQDLLRALDSSARAQSSPSMYLESRFNYSLSLEKLSLFALAKIAWKDYISRDPNSPWATEAKVHLRNIELADIGARWAGARGRLEDANSSVQDSIARDLVLEFPQFSREFGEETLLGRWGASWQEGKAKEAEQALSLARHLGHWLGTTTGEHMLEDSVAIIDRARIEGYENIALLARNHYSYQKTLAESSVGKCSTSEVRFQMIGLELTELGSPFARWALLRMATCEYEKSRYASASKILQWTSNLPGAKRYPTLAGTAYWTLGLIRGIEGDPAGSLDCYQKSLEYFDHSHEDENCAKILLLTAECLGYIGDLPRAWNYSWQSLQRVPRIRNSRKKYGVLSEAASIATELLFPEAALRFMAEAFQDSMDADPVGKVASYLGRATLCAEIGCIKDAQAALAVAFQLLPTIRDMDTRSTLRGDLLVIEGRIIAHRNLESARVKLSQAVDLYQRTSYAHQLIALLFERAKIEASLNQFERAEADLVAAIEGIERERRNTSRQDRESLLDQARQVYDEMSCVQLLLGRAAEALKFMENSRARLLLDYMSVSGSPPLHATGAIFLGWLQHSIAPNAVIVEYQIMGDSCNVWIISNKKLRFMQLEGSYHNIDREIRTLLETAGQDAKNAEFLSASMALFDHLIRPIIPQVRMANEIVFVPDGMFHQIPFPALLDRNSGRFLVQDFNVVLAPSSVAHALAARRKEQQAMVPSNILAIGNPIIDRGVWSLFPDLSSAGPEVRGIARIYPFSRLLTGMDATPSSFLEVAPKFQVIHMAVHGISDAGNPSQSMFIMSSGPFEKSGALYARDIRNLRLRSTRLVVLNACGSVGTHIGKTEGLSGLASSFLQAGVPTVVGTLWRVEDTRAQSFALLLHKWVRKGLGSASALRSAQMEAIQLGGGAISGSAWAAFEAFGS
jgi:CHAT domain-containing protein